MQFPHRILAQFAAIAVALQALLGLPLTLRMHEFGPPICTTSHAGGTNTPATHEHAHCLLCTGSLAPALLPPTASLPPPITIHLAQAAPATPAGTLHRLRPAFSPRAPPASA